jgi:hypothetical protein
MQNYEKRSSSARIGSQNGKESDRDGGYSAGTKHKFVRAEFVRHRVRRSNSGFRGSGQIE